MRNQILCFLFISLFIASSYAQLNQNFYQNTCPDVESIVKAAVTKKFQQTFVAVPATLRLFVHDCFVRGCDASVFLVNANAEKDHPEDISLAGEGFDTVIKAKAALDSNPSCQNKVSCADILALATRDVVALSGGPSYSVELGRRDGMISTKASVQNKLPQPEFKLDQLNTMFENNGLSQTDMIALSGAHTLGSSHCGKFSSRLHAESGIDPTLDQEYALQLRQMCPVNVDPGTAINLDPTTPQIFDNAYFKNLQQGKGLLVSDQILFTDNRSQPMVNLFASNETAFNEAFVIAITKLGRIGVLTGDKGEMRRDCTRRN